MILYDKSRYGLKPLYLITHRNDKYRCNPNDAITTFINEINASNDGAKALFSHDITTPGTYIDFTPSAYKANREMTSIVHSVFSMAEVVDKNVDTMLTPDGNASLVEIPSAEAFFVIYKNEYNEFAIFPVLDFAGSLENPTDVQVADEFNQVDELWIPAAPDASGARLGGVPLNSDGTSYNGPWPHAEDGHFSFIGQHQLVDGRYLYVFSNYDAENYDYTSMMDGDDTDPYTVVLVEGQAGPAGVVMQYGGEQACYSPDDAYTLKPCQSVKRYPPVWVQDSAEPEDPNWKFLMGYGFVQGPMEMDFASDFYLYWNSATQEAKVLMQCS